MSGVAYPLAGPRSRRAGEPSDGPHVQRGLGGRSVRRRFTTKTRRARRRGVPGPQNKVTHGRAGGSLAPPRSGGGSGGGPLRRRLPCGRVTKSSDAPHAQRRSARSLTAEARRRGGDRLPSRRPRSWDRSNLDDGPHAKRRVAGRGHVRRKGSYAWAGGRCRKRPDGAGRHRPGDEIERWTPCPAEILRKVGSKLNDGPHAKRSGRCGGDEPLDRDRFALRVWSTRKTRNSTLSHFAYEGRSGFDWPRPSVPRSAGLRSGGSAD